MGNNNIQDILPAVPAVPLLLLSSPLCSENPLELDLDFGIDLLFELLLELKEESGTAVLLVRFAKAFFTDLNNPPDSSVFSGFVAVSVGGIPRKSDVFDVNSSTRLDKSEVLVLCSSLLNFSAL